MSSNIEAKITETARDNQFTVIGDAMHADPNIRDFVYGKDVMQALRDGGVKHVFIEVPQSMQHNADGLVSGITTREQFINFMSSPSNMEMEFGTEKDARAWCGDIADQILYAKENGMKVHFADPQPDKDYEAIMGPNMERISGEAIYATLRKNGIEPTGNSMDDMTLLIRNPKMHAEALVDFDNRVAALPSTEKAVVEQEIKEFDETNAAYDAARLNDEQLHDYVTKVAGDQKAAVIYGASHDDLGRRLTESGHSHASIDVFASKEQFEANVPKNRSTYEYVAFVKEDMVQAAPASPPNEMQPASTPKQLAPAM